MFYWNKGTDNRRWNVKKYYHPNCYIEQGLDYLKLNPYTPAGKRGQPKMELTIEQRRQRFLLLRRKAALDIRRRKLSQENPNYGKILEGIDMRMLELSLEITKVGGIPKRWVDTLLGSI